MVTFLHVRAVIICAVAAAPLCEGCARPRDRSQHPPVTASLCPKAQQAGADWHFLHGGQFPHALADSLATAAAQPHGLDVAAINRLRRFFQFDTSYAAQATLVLAFRDAAKYDLRIRLSPAFAQTLGSMFRSGDVNPQAIFAFPWNLITEEELQFLQFALMFAGTDSAVVAADERFACLELDRLAPLFTPGTAETLMSISVDPTAFNQIIRNLEHAGSRGHSAVERIQALAAPDTSLARFVDRVVRGLELERWNRPTPNF